MKSVPEPPPSRGVMQSFVLGISGSVSGYMYYVIMSVISIIIACKVQVGRSIHTCIKMPCNSIVQQVCGVYHNNQMCKGIYNVKHKESISIGNYSIMFIPYVCVMYHNNQISL